MSLYSRIVSTTDSGDMKVLCSRISSEIVLMRGIVRYTLCAILFFVSFRQQMSGADSPNELNSFFRQYVHLSDDQIRQIREGSAVAKILDTPSPDEVFVFGSIYIDSTPEQYLTLAADIDALRRLPNYLAIRKFSDPPQAADLAGFTLEPDDIKELQRCKPSHCEVQLPSDAMQTFQQSVNWAEPDRADQVNHLAQKMALQALQSYMQGGNARLGIYRDKQHPTAVAETFISLLSQMRALPVYLPELNQYLVDYPRASSKDIESQFYWEKVNFGLKPTLRIVQAVVYRGPTPDKPAYGVAVKQLYASHYFETALDLTVCVRDTDNKGFYLITIKGSQQAGLTGFKGGIVRKVAVDKTRSSLEKALLSIKQQLEAKAH